MTNAVRAESRKLFSVRSTYVIFGLVLCIVVLLSFYAGGWQAQKTDVLNPLRLFAIDQRVINFIAVFPAIIGLLLFTHEFRYGTIAYSLTFSNRRSKVLAAKVLVVSALAIVVTAIVLVVTPLLVRLGMTAHHLHLIHQNFAIGSLAWRGLVYGWGYAMAGLVIAVLVRNQIGAIVTLLIFPGTIEGLLGLWLKNNAVYLPFTALQTMLGSDSVSGASLTPVRAMLVFLGYLAVAWSVAWYLFNKRDAV